MSAVSEYLFSMAEKERDRERKRERGKVMYLNQETAGARG
jgi:hypothetical protein